MKIRHAEQQDAEEIHEVALKTWKETYGQIFSDETVEEIIGDSYQIEELREQVKNPIFYVAEVNDKVVGRTGKCRKHKGSTSQDIS